MAITIPFKICGRWAHLSHDDVIKWKHFSRYWPFVRGIHRWASLTKASDAKHWCFLRSARLSKQSRRRWIETPLHSLWRHYNEHPLGHSRNANLYSTDMKIGCSKQVIHPSSGKQSLGQNDLLTLNTFMNEFSAVVSTSRRVLQNIFIVGIPPNLWYKGHFSWQNCWSLRRS